VYLEDYMSELKACPFCGQELTYFGRDRWYGEVGDCYKHPQSETIKCPISSLIFPKDLWNTRPIESALQSALTTAQEENKRLVEAHKEICRRYHTITKNAKKWQLEADLACMYDFAQSALNGGKL
jgi:hypothetical protein